MRTLGLVPDLSLWLIAAREEPELFWSGEGPARAPSERYRQAAAAQKIFYAPGSLTQDLRLEAAFEALGESAPSVAQAREVHASLGASVPLYAFEAEGDVWHLRNTSRPAFDAPFGDERWVLFAKTSDTATRRVELAAHEIAGAFAFMPLLDGHHTAAEVRAAAASSAAGTRVLEALDAALVEEDEEPFALEDLPDLVFVSHSSVFVRGERGSVLVDPAILPATEYLSRPGRRPFELASQASAVLVSHHHWDHFALQTMLRVPRETTIVVPRETRRALVNPPLRPYLEAFGFRNVVEVSAGDSLTFGDVEVSFLPFFGEPFGLDSRFDAFTYLVRVGGKTIYGSLDACHDEAGTMDPVFEELARDAKVDLFLFGASDQRHDPLYRAGNVRHYSNELVRRPDMVRYHPNVDDVIRWSAMLRPKAIVPYANFVYFGAERDDLSASAAENVAAYFRDAEEALGRLPAPHVKWRGELSRLAAHADPTLLMLHPMQGLRL